ncbi:MAG: MFS transporter [Gammaproteobacteria bacterium]|nr:MFS transporter [Gammaproteobacteria bacterium]
MRQVPLSKDNYSSFRLIAPFFIIIILDAMSFGMVTPVLAPLVTQSTSSILGANLSDVSRHLIYGLIQTSSFLCFMIGAPILGYLSDRLGRRKVLIYCLCGSFLGLCAYAYSFETNNLLILFVARIVVGFVSGNQAIAQSAIADISPRGASKASNIGLIAVAMTIGLVAGPLLGGVLSDPTVYSKFTNATPFYVGIVFSLFNLAILLLFLRETNTDLNPTHKLRYFWREFRALISQLNIRWLILTFFLFELGWTLYFQSLALVLVQDFNLKNKSIGLFSSYVGLLLSLGLFYGVRVLVKHVTLQKIIMPSLVMGSVSLFLGFLLNSFWLQLIIAIPVCMTVAFCYAILITLISDKTSKTQQGLMMGTTDCFIALAFTITSLLGAWLAVYNAVIPELVAAVFWVGAMGLFVKARRTL